MAGKNDSGEQTAGSTTVGGREQHGSWQGKASAAEEDSGASNAHLTELEGKTISQEERPAMDVQRPLEDLKVPRGMLDRSLQAQLGRQLRAIYANVASEPVPGRFIRLLEELAATEKRR